MTAPIDYQAVLADLEAKRAQIDAAINVIRALVGVPAAGDEGQALSAAVSVMQASLGGAGSSVSANLSSGGQSVIQSDTFFGMSTANAIRKFLNMMKRPQPPRAIANALRDGGQVYATDEKTAYTNVYTALKRMKASGDAVQIKTGDWGLAEWYGGKSKGENE